MELIKAATKNARPHRAVYALVHEGRPLLSDLERDALWEIFQVPVYVMLVDRDHQLIGYECEAQNGMHVPQSETAENGETNSDEPVCPCGRPGRRIHAEAAKDSSAASRLLPAGA